jgi:hypothetical protein
VVSPSSYKKRNVNARINTFQRSLLWILPKTARAGSWMWTRRQRIYSSPWAYVAPFCTSVRKVTLTDFTVRQHPSQRRCGCTAAGSGATKEIQRPSSTHLSTTRIQWRLLFFGREAIIEHIQVMMTEQRGPGW